MRPHRIVATNAVLDGASASDEVVYQDDRSQDQQEMNQAGAATYTRYKPQQPKDQQDYKYCPQHDSHSLLVAPFNAQK